MRNRDDNDIITPIWRQLWHACWTEKRIWAASLDELQRLKHALPYLDNALSLAIREKQGRTR